MSFLLKKKYKSKWKKENNDGDTNFVKFTFNYN